MKTFIKLSEQDYVCLDAIEYVADEAIVGTCSVALKSGETFTVDSTAEAIIKILERQALIQIAPISEDLA